MRHGIAQTMVTVVQRAEVVKVLAQIRRLQAGLHWIDPLEQIKQIRLIQPIHRHRIVGCRAPKDIAH